ncbi:MAG: tetratricopeptide repeat protein [Nocardiopsaceae bacterium]|nr:tetratricopeptide repeat protein [Nocardiopsaceae bacterium]
MTAEDTLRRAQALADLGRHGDAEPLIAQVLAAEPDNEDALALLGHCLVKQDRFADATDVTDRLLAVNPDNLPGLLRAALMRRSMDRPRDAVPFVRRAVELYPDQPVCLVNLSETLHAATPGSAEALEIAERATAIDPGYAWAFRLAGKIHLATRHYAEAERWTLQALANDPGDWQAVLQLGLARAGLGRFDESREQVRDTLRLRPDPGVIDTVIEHIERCGIPAELAEIYQMALAALGQPDLSSPGSAGSDPELLARQAQLAARLHKPNASPEAKRQAAALADAVLANDPGNADARYVRALALISAEDYARAIPLAQQLAAEGYPDADRPLLIALADSGDYAGALAVAQRGLADDPDSELHLRIGTICLLKLDRPAEALQFAQRCATLVPANFGVQLNVGKAAKAAGDRDLAERALRTAVANDTGRGEASAELALLLAEDDRWPEAEALIAGLPADVSDGSEVALGCSRIARLAYERAEPLLDQIGPDGADPAIRDEGARWIGVMAGMWADTVHYRPDMKGKIGEVSQRALGAMRKVPAPPDSDYARVMGELEALMKRCGTGTVPEDGMSDGEDPVPEVPAQPDRAQADGRRPS